MRRTSLPTRCSARRSRCPRLLLAPFLAFFFLRDGRRFLKFCTDAVPNAVLRANAVHGRARRRHRARVFPGTAEAHAARYDLPRGLDSAVIGDPNAFALGLMAAVLAWVPFVGSDHRVRDRRAGRRDRFSVGSVGRLRGGRAVPVRPRLLDDFVFMPLTVGRSLHMHPLPTVVLIFVGGAVAGITGLILVLPLAGVIMVIAGTIGGIVNDPRLRARNTFANDAARRGGSPPTSRLT